MLILLPADNPTQKRSLLAVAKLLSREGRQVSVVPADEASHCITYSQSKLPVD